MDLREVIILGGGALIGLIVLHGIWVAWRKYRNPLRMKIEPDLVPENEADNWLNGELPNGGVRVRSADSNHPGAEPDAPPAPAAAQPGKDAARPKEEDVRQERRPAPAREPPEAREEVDILVIHVLTCGERPFPGADLLAAMRSQGLKYGDKQIFHRIDPQNQQSMFSVANAVEPGYFDLDQDCASPGLTAFLKLPGPRDAAALEDMLTTTAAIAEALDGVRLDGDRTPFTDAAAQAYRTRIAEFARRRRER